VKVVFGLPFGAGAALQPAAATATRLGETEVLGFPRNYKSAHAFLWEYGQRRLELAQLLSQCGIFLTLWWPEQGSGWLRPAVATVQLFLPTQSASTAALVVTCARDSDPQECDLGTRNIFYKESP
jgi:hypothetical protein